MCLLIHSFLSADPSDGLGRPDYALLPQQTLMELFSEKVKFYFYGAKDSKTDCYKDISRWRSVELNDRGEVVSFGISNYSSCEGEIDFQLLPSTVQRLEISLPSGAKEPLSFHGLPLSLKALTIGKQFHGKIETACLPRQTESIDIHGNRFTGSLDFRTLPPEIRELNLSDNDFSGCADCTNLPKTLVILEVHTNRFSGVIDLSAIPPKLMRDYEELNSFTSFGVSIENNQFDKIAWETVNKRINRIDANMNELTGLFEAKKLPHHLQVLKVSNNHYEGPLSLKDLPRLLRWLEASSNRLNGRLDLTVLPDSMRILTLSRNGFQGPINLSALPNTFGRLDLSFNKITGPMGEIRLGKTPTNLKFIDLRDNKIREERVSVRGVLKKSSMIDLRGNEIGSVNRDNVRI